MDNPLLLKISAMTTGGKAQVNAEGAVHSLSSWLCCFFVLAGDSAKRFLRSLLLLLLLQSLPSFPARADARRTPPTAAATNHVANYVVPFSRHDMT